MLGNKSQAINIIEQSVEGSSVAVMLEFQWEQKWLGTSPSPGCLGFYIVNLNEILGKNVMNCFTGHGLFVGNTRHTFL